MAYQQNYYDDLGYQEGMEDTELMYYQDQYDRNYQFQQSQLPVGQQSFMQHRYSISSCKSAALTSVEDLVASLFLHFYFSFVYRM